MKYQIAIVGPKDTILGFKALGLKTYNALDTKEAVKVLFELKKKVVTDEKSGETRPLYAIIFVIEDLMARIEDSDYKKLSQDALPAIVPVPGTKGATGYSLKRIGKMVEQAVGSDIFGDK
ncbi:MAG: V-type ATP synthase subunit F [Nitrospirae bacterium]|nr:V-type ATP synthase subunit F [Nitrospirota bacterium]